ncbi:hypothetical protein N2152v2_009835 [Parachlorella kessleri]
MGLEERPGSLGDSPTIYMAPTAQVAILAVLTILAFVLPAGHALSSPLCGSGGETWVTKQPYRNPLYPGADLYFFCESGLNVMGDSLDPCLNQGSLCTQAATDAMCKFLGYDLADDASTSVRAQPGEVVRTLTGEYCLREGTYSKTLPDNLAAMPGKPCLRVDAINCVRTQQRMADSLQAIIMEAVSAPKSPTPLPSTKPAATPPAPAVTAASGPAEQDSNGKVVCSSGLNVLGDSLDPCLNQGSLCTQAATDAICKFLGYDFADGASTSVRAQANETVRTLTGEYCLREGTYSKSLPANLATMPGTPCLHIDAITCVRTQQHISESLQSIVMDATTARKAPQSSAPATMPTSSDNITAAGGPDDRASTGGRKMKL